jgi:hypothetical protein
LNSKALTWLKNRTITFGRSINREVKEKTISSFEDEKKQALIDGGKAPYALASQAADLTSEELLSSILTTPHFCFCDVQVLASLEVLCSREAIFSLSMVRPSKRKNCSSLGSKVAHAHLSQN